LGLSFFGLTSKNSSQAKIAIYRQIHQICFHGKGGYDWHTVYNMPIWLRRFTFSEIKNYYAEEEKEIKNQTKSGSKTVIDSNGKIKSPEFLKSQSTSKRPVKYK
jgi:hypothetical protein